jgi:hypothetical protein
LKEAMNSPDEKEWKKAMESELKSMKDSGSFRVLYTSKREKSDRLQVDFSLKTESCGNIERYKARLCAQGFYQRQGTNYSETFAPVCTYASVRMVLAIANALGLETRHLDIRTAF